MIWVENHFLKSGGIMKKFISFIFTILIVAFLIGVPGKFRTLKEQEAQRNEETEQAVKHVRELNLDPDSRFYYNSLDDSHKEVYQTILDGVRQHKEKITIQISDAEEANEIYQKMMMDYPEYFWCDGTARTTAYSDSYGSSEGYSEIEPGYCYSKEESEKRDRKIQAIASDIISKMDDNDSDYEKVKFIYEYIINTTDYDSDAEDNQNIYSVLVGKKSVCAGYAKTVQYLLNRIGMFCTYVVGTVGDGESHAWNIVECDGKYYNVDVTWGDPVFAQKMEDIEENNITYDYLCCSDEELNVTHHADSKFQYPECTSDDLNYYRQNGIYYKEYNKEEAYEAMKRSIDRKEPETVFKYAGETAYKAACKNLLEKKFVAEGARYLCKKYSLSQVNYYYQNDDKLHKITIFWKYSE